MNEELAARHAELVEETLGFPGRMISFSKTGYGERHPEHVSVFNANVCLAAGKVWHGDLDLTLDEPRLLELAERVGETVYVLYEYDGRFENEDEPLLEQAVYSAASSGHTRFEFRYLERRPDGTLGRRPPEPDRRPRWRWRVLRHRPRLLRFWQLGRKRSVDHIWSEPTRTSLIYAGARDGGRTPLLVLGWTRGPRLRFERFEATWYPTAGEGPRRHAARPLFDLQPSLRVGPLHVWLRLLVWPGLMYELLAGYRMRRYG